MLVFNENKKCFAFTFNENKKCLHAIFNENKKCFNIYLYSDANTGREYFISAPFSILQLSFSFCNQFLFCLYVFLNIQERYHNDENSMCYDLETQEEKGGDGFSRKGRR